MEPQDLRLECLRLAHRDQPVADLINEARAFADFVMGIDSAALADEAKAAVDRAAG